MRICLARESQTVSCRVPMVAPQSFSQARGAPFSFLHRVRALVTQGVRVDLVTYPFGEDVELDRLKIVRAGWPPFVRNVKIGPSTPKLALDVPLHRETVRQLGRREYDVIHSHETDSTV